MKEKWVRKFGTDSAERVVNNRGWENIVKISVNGGSEANNNKIDVSLNFCVVVLLNLSVRMSILSVNSFSNEMPLSESEPNVRYFTSNEAFRLTRSTIN